MHTYIYLINEKDCLNSACIMVDKSFSEVGIHFHMTSFFQYFVHFPGFIKSQEITATIYAFIVFVFYIVKDG